MKNHQVDDRDGQDLSVVCESIGKLMSKKNWSDIRSQGDVTGDEVGKQVNSSVTGHNEQEKTVTMMMKGDSGQ